MRRWIGLTGLTGLAVLGVLGILAQADRPGAVSPAIYPPVEQRGLRFSHAEHRKQACVTCHASVRRSVSTADRNLPTEAMCSPCHAPDTRAPTGALHSALQSGSPTPRAENKGLAWSADPGRCRTCHPQFDGRRPPMRTIYRTANLRFGHRLHDAAGVPCVTCHRFASSGGAEPELPRMASCVGCHRQRKVDGRCVTCHLSNKDGRLRTQFASGKLRPSGALAGDAHTGEFRRRHTQVARANRRYCESCHTPRDCLRCHAGSLRPMTIHSGDYATRHAQDARRNSPRCDSCHRSQTFCLGCHQRLGVGQETAGGGFRSSTGRPFHPPGFVSSSRGPGHHSYSARRSIQTCTACHRETTCIRCHGSRSLGRGGFSPHGPGFGRSAKCRALAARNQRVCLKCHHLSDGRTRCN